ncbi:hypothetical protein niasHS_016883 [Heterodera schachtii]|uniref:Uncharacterized protein n=1 Tax=Heterodera schachtii TaxID=97005 RepID=A0ABD2HVN3_HETSC
MAPGLKLPRELLFDVGDLFVRNRRWARCRVNKAVDNYLLYRMGPWLLNVQQLNHQIGMYSQQILNFIPTLNDPFASSFTGMLLQNPIDVAKEFCCQLELRVQNYKMTTEISDSSKQVQKVR